MRTSLLRVGLIAVLLTGLARYRRSNHHMMTKIGSLLIALVVGVAACGGNTTETADTIGDQPDSTTAAPTTTVAAIEETPTTTEVAETPTTTAVEETTTTTEVAAIVSDEQAATIAAYETSWNDGNEDVFRTLLAPGASLDDSTFGNLADVDRIVTSSVNRLAMGVELSIDGCSLGSAAEVVICTAEFDGLVPIAMNLVPWRDRYIFTFEDGQIAHIKVDCIICWDGGADDRLRAWVNTVDETAWDITYYGYNLVLTAEKAAFWLEWAPKWQEAGRP